MTRIAIMTDIHANREALTAVLADIERQLEHFVTGRYSAANRHPMG